MKEFDIKVSRKKNGQENSFFMRFRIWYEKITFYVTLLKIIKYYLDEDLPTYAASELNHHGPASFGLQKKIFLKKITWLTILI